MSCRTYGSALMTDEDEIGFTELPHVDAPAVSDLRREDMKDQVGDSIARAKMKDQLQPPASAAPAKPEIPPELPDLLFRIGAKAMNCPAFRTDDADNILIARPLSIVLGGINSRLFSCCMIMIIIASKTLTCFDAIKAKFKKKEPE